MFNTALHLNSKGVQHLKLREIDNARACFVSALDTMKKMSGKYTEDESFVTIDVYWSDRYLKQEPDDVFVFSRALVFMPKQQQKSHLTNRERDLLAFEVTISILYNIALSLHMAGMEKNCKTMLRKSLKGYNFTLDKIKKRSQLFCSANDENVGKTFFLSLGILNNLGQVHMEFDLYVEAQRYFRQLGELMKTTTIELDELPDIDELRKRYSPFMSFGHPDLQKGAVIVDTRSPWSYYP